MNPSNASAPVTKKELFGWCCYDFANSAYTTIIITVVFQVYFANTIGEGEPRALAAWGWFIGISQILVILLSPGLGMLADLQASKKRFLVVTTLTCSLSTIALATTGPGTVILAGFLLILSNLAYSLGENFCASFLPELSTPENCGKISGYGWSFGYCGGLVSLGLAILLLKTLGSSADTSRWIFVVTGFFFAISALPTFLFVRERKRPQTNDGWLSAFKTSWKQQIHLFGELKQHPALLKFFIAFLCFMAGIYVIITYASLFAGQELGFTQEELIGLFAALQLSSAIGAFCFGFFQDKVGPKTVLIASLLLWIIVCISAAFCTSKLMFFVIGNLAGLGIGSTQSTSRAVVSLLAPKSKAGEYFGFWGAFGKLAAVIGPISFGQIASGIGMRPTIGLTTGFFLAGLLILSFLPLKLQKNATR
ncbi:MAG: MFS transporter [Verrucomicrobiota bacterium]